MQFVFLPLIHFGTILVYSFLAAFVLFQSPRATLNRTVALFLLPLGLWSLSNMMVHNPGINWEAVRIWNNIGALGWISFSSLFLSFVLVLTEKKHIVKNWQYLIAVHLPIPFFLFLQLKGLLLVDYQKMIYGWTYSWSSTVWPLVFYLYYLSIIILGLFLLASYYNKTDSALKKKQVKIMIVTGALSLAVGTLTNVLSQQLRILVVPPLANISAVIWALGVVYAIAKYRFLGIDLHSAARNIVNTISDALILIDQNGHITAINPATEKMLGYGSEELRGISFNRISGEMRLEEKMIGGAHAGSELKDYYTFLTGKNSGKVPVNLSTSVLRDEKGKVSGLVCAAKNISELKQAEKQLRQRAALLEKSVSEISRSENTLRQAFTQMSDLKRNLEDEKEKVISVIASLIDPIIVVDKEDRLSLLNPAAEKVLKMTLIDLGKKIDPGDNYALDSFSDLINVECEIKNIDPVDGQKAEEIIIKEADMELSFLVLTVPIISAQGAYLGMMKLFSNTSREKHINKLKSEFISVAAHQLRTPLSAIKWAIRMVLDGDTGQLNDDQKMILTKGYLSNERVITLINDMLNVSQIEEGRFGYKFARTDLLPVIRALVKEKEPQAKTKNIDLRFDCALESAFVGLDLEKMGMAIKNLFDNALKYTPDNGRIDLKVEREGSFVRVKIKDNGIGIPRSEQEKVFSKFFRANNALQAETDGSGLGLFIAKNIIEEHGGRIGFNSKEGSGTEFSFSLPLAD